MNTMYYVGLDIHKKTISFCIKRVDGRKHNEGKIRSTRKSLDEWLGDVPESSQFTMEATMFTGWIYDHLVERSFTVTVAHPEMVKAITAAKKKNDRSDAEKLADLLRTDLLPECYIAPPDYRELRRMLRFRNLIIREATKLKNRTSGMLMEVGAEYDKKRLHGKAYFHDLLERLDYVPDSVIEMLEISRDGIDMFTRIQRKLITALRTNSMIRERVELLMTIPGIGEVTALTWVLEMAEIDRFSSIRKAISYCGLCSAQNESGGISKRGPLSKKRNAYLQTKLIEAAKLAPQWNSDLAVVYDRECLRGNHNQATIAVARKLVAYMYAVDNRGTAFVVHEPVAVA